MRKQNQEEYGSFAKDGQADPWRKSHKKPMSWFCPSGALHLAALYLLASSPCLMPPFLTHFIFFN